MRISITEEERLEILSKFTDPSNSIRKKLLKVRKRKSSTYKKCATIQIEKFKLLREVIKNNYKIKDVDLIKRLKISKATFYRVYSTKAKEWREECSKEALF